MKIKIIEYHNKYIVDNIDFDNIPEKDDYIINKDTGKRYKVVRREYFYKNNKINEVKIKVLEVLGRKYVYNE